MNADHERAPRCPRCGYDLSGHRALLEDTRPARGTCSECGLEFEWADAFDPTRAHIPGFIEHETGGLVRRFLSAWRTLAWTVIPTVFWGKVTVESRIVPRRWLLWAVLLILPLHAAGSVLSNTIAWLLLIGPGRSTSPAVAARCANGWMYPLLSIDERFVPGRWIVRAFPVGVPVFVWSALAAGVAYWGTLLLLRRTRGLARVRAAHLCRAAVYGSGWFVGVTLFRALRNLELAGEAFINPVPQMMVGRVFRLSALDQRLVAVPLVAWLAGWWLVAMKNGWRMERWGRVWALLTVVAVLAALVPFVWEDEISRAIDRIALRP